MTRTRTRLAARQALALEGLRGLPGPPSDHALVTLRCRSAHHVAAVYATDVGLVYATRTRRHSHGDRDRVDVGHHAARAGLPWVDLLESDDPAEGDALPASCECGPRLITRAYLLAALRHGDRRLVLG